MTYDEFLTQVIDGGVAGVRKDYVDDISKREGSVAGFEACRGKQPVELRAVLTLARKQANDAFWASQEGQKDPDGRGKGPNHYWYWRCFELEVEWVCDVVSALLMNSGLGMIVPPTCRGVAQAAEIVGVKGA